MRAQRLRGDVLRQGTRRLPPQRRAAHPGRQPAAPARRSSLNDATDAAAAEQDYQDCIDMFDGDTVAQATCGP
jgi:hypothetical protein